MSDIRRIGDKYYDFGTKNTSFLLTAQELKTLGIKNWYFMLEVKRPDLGVQDIDPHAENISAEDAGRVIIECKANPWYFFRECARVPVTGAGVLSPILTRASLAACWCFVHSFDFKLCQPRQTHKTTWCTIILEYMFLFEYQNARIPMMHLKLERCKQNASLFRDYVYTLPPYMNPWSERTKPPGVMSLKYEEHHTELTVLAQSDSREKAKDALRGATSAAGAFDEWEYIPYFADVMEGGAPAITSARNIIRAVGGRTCIMMYSTPGDLETDIGRDTQRMIDATPVFSEKLYDFTNEELLALFEEVVMPDGEVRKPVTGFYIEFNYKQLRKDERWLRQQYQELVINLGKTDEYRRGVLLQRYRGSGSVLFAQSDIDYITQHTKEPDYEIFLLKKFHLYVYKHHINRYDLNSDTPFFDVDIPYLIGVDVAAGGGGDNTAFIIVHPYTLEVVGELISPYIGITDLMRVVIEIAKLCPSGIFCVETNSIGKGIVDLVQETNLEHRFYHDPKLDISKNAVEHDETPEMTVKRKSKEKGYIGTYVTPQVRKNMFDLLKTHVKEYKQLLCTKYLARDITNLVRAKNGKIEAAEGFHDDMVMAYNHVLYVWYYGYKIERFGILKYKATFQKAQEAVNQYEIESAEEQVNNIVPYKDPNCYENQLLREMLSRDPMGSFANNGRDDYGYRRRDYNGGQDQLVGETVTASDMAFMNEVNVWY